MVQLSLILVGFGHSLIGDQLKHRGNSYKKKKYLSHHLMTKAAVAGTWDKTWEAGVDLEVQVGGHRGCEERQWTECELESRKHQHLKGKRAGE